MKPYRHFSYSTILFVCFCIPFFSGCFKTYTVVQERADQSLVGNRGVINGPVPEQIETRVVAPRKIIAVDIELSMPKKCDIIVEPKKPGSEVYYFPEKNKKLNTAEQISIKDQSMPGEDDENVEPIIYYVVKKSDTLEKIAKQMYGDSRKWTIVYAANKENIKNPSHIRPGQKLLIPNNTEKMSDMNAVSDIK